jgi:hypothetical protein
MGWWMAEAAAATHIFSSISSQREDFTINNFEWHKLLDFSKSQSMFILDLRAEYRNLWGTDLAAPMTTSIASTACFIFAYEVTRADST